MRIELRQIDNDRLIDSLTVEGLGEVPHPGLWLVHDGASYLVLQRTREIGVRMAVGAGRRDIVQLVFRQGSGWVLAGVVIGLGGALALATALRSMVYGMDTLNPLTLLAATGAVAVAAMVACWLPARRAAQVDPMIALRAE